MTFEMKGDFSMRTKHKVDMTQGRIAPLVLRFALPLCLGSVLQQMYSTVDTLVVGNFCSPVSLAALGTSGQPIELLLLLLMGISSGVSILVAQYTGSGDDRSLRVTVDTAVSFLYMAAVPLTVVGIFIGPMILRLMQVPPDAYPYARSYIMIFLSGTLASMGYNMNAGILRGLGDSQSSLLFLAISCVLNIVLDLLFVAWLGMDVAGAALATVIAQFVSWACTIIYIKTRYPELEFSFLPRRVDRDALRSLMRVGIPLGINQSFYSVGHLLMQSLINAQGSLFIAACAVGSKLAGIANMMIASLSQAAATYSAQNYGAKKYDRVRRGIVIPFISGGITLAASIVMLLLARPLLGLFTDDPQVLELSLTYLGLLQPFTCCYAVFNGIINIVHGIGEMRYPTIVNVLMLWGVRIPVGHLIANVFGGYYVSAAISVSFIFGLTCMLIYLRGHRWREIGMLAKRQAME